MPPHEHRHPESRLAAAALLVVSFGACQVPRRPPPPPPPPEPAPTSTASPAEPEPLPVKQVEEDIVVAAWAEPSRLPRGGGQVQVLVRVQKPGGAPYPGVEVRLRASTGSLYSKGEILMTDARGMTRDRLSTRQTARVTLNAGGTRYTIRVPVGEDPPPQP